MKIGIISMQRVPNYGSFLQAMGLKTILENMGHEVVFLDYKAKSPVVPHSTKDVLAYKIKTIPFIAWMYDHIQYNFLGKKKFAVLYRLKYLKSLKIGYTKNYSEKVDVAVIGSDEVFNCLQKGANVGFSPMLFGCGVNAKKVISYAASFGYTSIDGLIEYSVEEKIENYLRKFADLSVRDENSYRIIHELLGSNPKINLDPVLVADYKLPDVKIKYENYVLLYTYKSRKYSESEIKEIKKFCETNNKILISIGNAQPWIEHHEMVEPLEVLKYIQAADFIITDTFHGTVFSIKYNKEFATLIRPDNENKLKDLLCRLKKEERIIRTFSELNELYQFKTDFSETNSIIDLEKENTYKYLVDSIEAV